MTMKYSEGFTCFFTSDIHSQGYDLKLIFPIHFWGHLGNYNDEEFGVWPITIRCFLWRVAARCASVLSLSNLTELLASCQLSFGISHSMEGAVQAASIHLYNLRLD